MSYPKYEGYRSEPAYSKTWVACLVFSSIIFLTWVTTIIVFTVQFERNCEGRLKRAADANTVELASQELNSALGYLESNKLTTGYTSILYTTPDEDIEYWYQNLKKASEELSKVGPEATQLEKTNVLMKLRETLLDQGETGVSVTVPPGISKYPYNTLFGIWACCR